MTYYEAALTVVRNLHPGERKTADALRELVRVEDRHRQFSRTDIDSVLLCLVRQGWLQPVRSEFDQPGAVREYEGYEQRYYVVFMRRPMRERRLQCLARYSASRRRYEVHLPGGLAGVCGKGLGETLEDAIADAQLRLREHSAREGLTDVKRALGQPAAQFVELPIDVPEGE